MGKIYPYKPMINIENIVATVTLEQGLDLYAMERSVPNVEYDPDQFPGLIYRLESPKVTSLIFKSGKMVVTGAKSTDELIKAAKKIIRSLKRAGISITGKSKIQIQNIVASANLHLHVNLDKAAFLLENNMYEPEQFPGLIYRMDDPRVVVLIFSSGKMVITGAKREEEVYRAVKRIYDKLVELECVKQVEEEGELEF
ncbi:TATA-box-binding protein [Sulfodiicoccus acidiphilus]|uniref:TATA-box-binding protein n=2 Tax=Sulfodiicoccus acidiphilus TaxID=1670455 RepID=A0A348B386_9CREN|nr:TATA-box-binding protein [Sulfodiicoccus acidiphilus]GGT95799.1 TATA-box-binding protein [Sulfodiicoccus acidiphilus]